MENDGKYDWMNTAIPKSLSHLPEHVKGSDGNLRQDLLIPAPKCYRESYKESISELYSIIFVDAYKTHVSKTLTQQRIHDITNGDQGSSSVNRGVY